MNINEAVQGIMRWREVAHNKDVWHDHVKLSEIQGKLSLCNQYISDEISVAHKMATDKHFSVSQEVRRGGGNVTLAEATGKGESTDERAYYERLKILYKATEAFITSLQVRIRVIEAELKRGQLVT